MLIVIVQFAIQNRDSHQFTINFDYPTYYVSILFLLPSPYQKREKEYVNRDRAICNTKS